MAPLATLAKIDAGEFPSLVARVEQQISTLPSQEEQNQFWTIAYLLAGIKWRNKAMLDTLFKGKFKMIDSVTFQGTREDAQIEYGRKILLRELKRKFSDLPESITQKILSMNDLEKIDQIGDELLNLSTIDEVVALLS